MLTNREKQASRCRHDFEKLRLTEIVLICHFYNPGIDPQVGSDHTGHNFREAQYRCRKCGREICSPCYEDLMEEAEKATARETAEQQDESVTRHRGAFMESLMNDEEIEAHKDPSYEEVMEADGEGDPHGLYSAKVWNMSDAAKPSGAMYVGRAGHGEVGSGATRSHSQSRLTQRTLPRFTSGCRCSRDSTTCARERNSRERNPSSFTGNTSRGRSGTSFWILRISWKRRSTG